MDSCDDDDDYQKCVWWNFNDNFTRLNSLYFDMAWNLSVELLKSKNEGRFSTICTAQKLILLLMKFMRAKEIRKWERK